MIIFGCTNRQIHFKNGEIHSFDSYPKLNLNFKPQFLDLKNLDWDLVWEPPAARGSRPGTGLKPQSLASKNLDWDMVWELQAPTMDLDFKPQI